ncbi:MAG: hypothetical protein A2Z83_04685 [Omnitrophica bacterium GWA2_52_8]|nr:MAG: hypothetical protein A2Z83_04685 [Omnitrophica bacterium GWA2_52_8]
MQKKQKIRSRWVLLDIGNTAVTYAVCRNGKIIRTGNVLHDAIPNFVKNSVISGASRHITYLFISSVVPQLTNAILKLVKGSPSVRVYRLGRDIHILLKHKYKQYNNLGIDRLLNAFGVSKSYRAPAVIIDFGTAMTVDYLDKNHTFQGGLIIPGPELSYQSLIAKAALLPKNARLPKKNVSFYGKTTYECLQSGILQGYGAMTDELIRRFRAKYGKSILAVATGGFSKHLKPYSKELDRIDPLLTLKAIRLIAASVFKQT